MGNQDVSSKIRLNFHLNLVPGLRMNGVHLHFPIYLYGVPRVNCTITNRVNAYVQLTPIPGIHCIEK
jgi:hypothetical protein